MNNRDAAFIACRILALYLFVRGLMLLALLPSLFQGVVDRSVGSQVSMVILSPFALLILGGFLLWLHSETLARRMVPRAQPLGEESLKISAREIQAIAFSVAGAVILVNAVAGLFQAAPGLVMVVTPRHYPSTYHLQSIFLVVEKLVMLFLGLVLFVGGDRIAGLLKQLHGRIKGL